MQRKPDQDRNVGRALVDDELADELLGRDLRAQGLSKAEIRRWLRLHPATTCSSPSPPLWRT